MAEYIDRRQVKREARELLRDAQVPPRKFFTLYLALVWLMNLASYFANNSGGGIPALSNPLGLFVWILVSLLALILEAGCWLYCAAIRRGERTEYLTLFDGFSFAGRLILLYLAKMMFVFLWSLPSGMIFSVLLMMYEQEIFLFSPLMILLFIPPVVALYRYRFAILNLCEDPNLGVMETLNMSKRQTFGYKGQLFSLDLSFLGWMVLSSLPSIYLYAAEYLSMLDIFLPELPLGLSPPLQVIVPIIVGALYLPLYQTSELAYFETAKRTSGMDSRSRLEDHGPDDLGGYF
ncbi:DUF975 family protein [Dysosmobacter sp. HCP28S3_G4]|uniref:DUF975 family protein n=1 Tax=Dysosmobacter sp. HCP28S3_G4 TaxID=3438938 RepID=UPI003F8AD540